MDLIKVVKTAQNGDKKAFIQLIQYFEKDMYKVAKSLLQNEADRCDAVQEAILKAYEGVWQLRQPEYFKTWLMKILANNCYLIHRKNSRTTVVSELQAIESSGNGYAEVEMKQVLDCLDEDLKTLVVMYYLHDLPVKNISETLAIPEGTIKSKLSKARAQLSEALKPEQGGLCYE
ncbi:MAG: sigma-70 family RNA polymerase sigma factor [Actinobacteria bacterium]|nr:sigma-70 family RNA polymerase sigma factor [Actinomycetota bacterium]